MKRTALILITVIISCLYSCSATWHIKQACRKQPDLCVVKPPTSAINAQPLMAISLRTIGVAIFKDSTVTLKRINEKDTTIVRIHYKDQQADSLDVECPPSTHTVEFENKYIKLKPTFIQYIGAAGVGALVLALALLGFAISFKIKL